jgi:hypothetical protein
MGTLAEVARLRLAHRILARSFALTVDVQQYGVKRDPIVPQRASHQCIQDARGFGLQIDTALTIGYFWRF